MLLTRYEPFNLLDRFFQDDEGASFHPQANIIEKEKEYVLEVELPGLEKKDVKIEVRNNQLTIFGEKARENKYTKDGYTRYETSFGKFSRSWNLGDGIDVEKIDAQGREGVITITLPKTRTAIEKEKDEVKHIDLK